MDFHGGAAQKSQENGSLWGCVIAPTVQGQRTMILRPGMGAWPALVLPVASPLTRLATHDHDGRGTNSISLTLGRHEPTSTLHVGASERRWKEIARFEVNKAWRATRSADNVGIREAQERASGNGHGQNLDTRPSASIRSALDPTM